MSNEPGFSEEDIAGFDPDAELEQMLADFEHPRERVRELADEEATNAARFSAEYLPPPTWLNDTIIEVVRDEGYALRFVPKLTSHPRMSEELRPLFDGRQSDSGWYLVSAAPVESDDIAAHLLESGQPPPVLYAEGQWDEVTKPKTVSEFIAALVALDTKVPRLFSNGEVRMPSAKEVLYFSRTGRPDLTGEVLCVNDHRDGIQPVTLEFEGDKLTTLRTLDAHQEYDGGTCLMRKIA